MRTPTVTAIAAAAILAAPAAASETTKPKQRRGVALHPHAQLRMQLERALFGKLPADVQRRALPNLLGPLPAAESYPSAAPLTLGSPEATALTSLVVDPSVTAHWTPLQQNMFLRATERAARGLPIAPNCFTQDTDPAMVEAFDALLHASAGDPRLRFRQTARWTNTATNPVGPFSQGSPTTLTYGYAPDGTFVPNIIGVTGTNNLFAWLNSIYGSPAVWQPFFDDAFDTWEALTGITYVFEPNDDGSQLNTLAGELGVRADLRIAAITIDGNSGTLAYNNFPNDGDMVFDSADGFFNNLAVDSLGFRNVILHEHGHGQGMLHVCPIEQSILMEPFVSTAFSGPQLDDILNGQRHYGDPLEPNDAAPADLGAPGFSSTEPAFTLDNVSLDDDSDIDLYAIDLPADARYLVAITPRGEIIRTGSQTGSCSVDDGVNYPDVDHRTVIDMRASAQGASDAGFTVQDANAAGAGESLTGDADDTLLVRVDGSGANTIQPYSISVFIAEQPGGSLDTTPPTVLSPFRSTAVSATYTPVAAAASAGTLFFRTQGQAGFTASAFSTSNGTDFTGSLPSFPCGTIVEYYVEVTSPGGLATRVPEFGVTTASSGTPVILIDDNAESDAGFVASGPATEGQWERGFPEDNTRGDPRFDADGSGRAWLTDVDMFDANSDVDGGAAILTSPTLNLSGDAVIDFSLWYTNSFGAGDNSEIFTVEVSNNGVDWVNALTVGPELPPLGWNENSIRLSDFVTPSATSSFRFIAKDDVGSIIEAGLDAITVTTFDCPPFCVADVTTTNTNPGEPGYGEPDGQADGADISYFVEFWLAGDASVADVTTTNTNPGDTGFGSPDGQVDGADLSFFIELWLVGCP